MAKARLVTRAALAKVLEINASTVTKWVAEGLPVAAYGRGGTPHRFDAAACQAWVAARAAVASSPVHLDLVQERARRERAQAQLAEQTLAIRSGTFVLREEMERAWAAEIHAVRTMLLGLSSHWSDRFGRALQVGGPTAMQKEIDASVREALLQFADPNRAIVDPDDAAPPADA